MRHKQLASLTIAGILAASASAFAQEAAKAAPPAAGKAIELEVKHDVSVRQALPPEAAAMKINIEAMRSPKMTRVLRDQLAGLGYKMVDNADEADIKMKVGGFISVGGIGRKEATIMLHELIESNKVAPADAGEIAGFSSTGRLVSYTVLWQAGVMGASANLLMPFAVVDWVSHATGVSAAINKAIAGDARGFCFSENCDKVRSSARIDVNAVGSSVKAGWTIKSTAWDTNVVVDKVFGAAIVEALKPFEDVAKTAGLSVPAKTASAK